MIRKLSALAVAGLALSAVTAARADFILTNGSSPAPVVPGEVRPGLGVVADTPHVDPYDQRKPHTDASVQRRIAPPSIVQGFGDQVPLAFACRQILPSSVSVTYGPGADPGMIVTWKGGDTWPHVLEAAIKPLGLHMLRSANTVTLES